MNQSHILFDTDKTAPTDDQGNAPQKAAGRHKRWFGAHGAGAPVSAVCIKPAIERCLPPHRCARRWLQGWIASPLAGFRPSPVG